MQQKINHSAFLIPGIILLGAILRIPITAIPPVLTQIATGLHIPVANLGILTTLPLLSFAIFSPLAPIVARKLGTELTFLFVLLLLLIGSTIRIFSPTLLYVGTFLVGVAIAHVNVLLPSLIMANFPNNIGKYTSIYTFMMGLMTAIFSAIAVPIVTATNWQFLIIILSTIIALALVIWLPNVGHNHKITPNSSHHITSPSAWKNVTAWFTLVFMGCQSAIFYTSIAWLPTIATANGVSSSTAGILAAINALISLPLSFLVPNIIAHLSTPKRRIFVILTSAAAAISFGMLLIPTTSFIFWLILNVLNGLAVGSLFPYILTTFSKKTSNYAQTAEISGMAQSGGYIIAALGPLLFGIAFNTFHSWTIQTVGMIFVAIIMAICGLAVEQKEKYFD